MSWRRFYQWLVSVRTLDSRVKFGRSRVKLCRLWLSLLGIDPICAEVNPEFGETARFGQIPGNCGYCFDQFWVDADRILLETCQLCGGITTFEQRSPDLTGCRQVSGVKFDKVPVAAERSFVQSVDRRTQAPSTNIFVHLGSGDRRTDRKFAPPRGIL